MVVTRFDLYLKRSLVTLMGAARSVDGFRLLWRESNGYWRYHTDRTVVRSTFGPIRKAGQTPRWLKHNIRAPDVLLAFPGAYTRCFLGVARYVEITVDLVSRRG